MECIILAGGLGTRLRNTIGDYPKCMAPVNNKPFMQYVFDYLERQGCTHLILSLGYKHEVVLNWLLEQQHRPFTIDHVIEEEPMGTGGALQYALTLSKEDNVVVLNGDTFFRVDTREMFVTHKSEHAAATLALKRMHKFDRYGAVMTDEENDCILSFEEKTYREHGWINGGVYIINKKSLLNKKLPEIYSLEKDYLQAFVSEGQFYGYKCDAYFIDIGIAEDYHKAQEDFKNLS